MDPRLIEEIFPNLKTTGYVITSPEDPHYNCIAWAAGVSDAWWWPPYPLDLGYFWPTQLLGRAGLSLSDFIAAFETLGYRVCADGVVEPVAEKIAIFESHGRVTHAARQLADGTWTSKLGTHQDIVHRIDGLDEGTYGTLAQFMKQNV